MIADKCEYCDGRIEEGKVTEYFEFKGTTTKIENVPVGVCSICGSRYYSAKVLRAMEAVARNRDKVQNLISVPVVSFDEDLDAVPR